MNEITRIHLGRQAFTIAVDAQKTLQAYLDAIKKQAGENSDDVIKEVELRMAELLAERGVTSDKVVLMEDIQFLKDQLGSPKDFKEDREDESADQADASATKRLFRDTDNAMIAGVAAGLANYFKIDVLLVRVLFIIGALAGGWGILLYIALWLLVPETKSSSDRLQMLGKAVTAQNLKEIVDRADFQGAAHRAGGTVSRLLNSVFKTFFKIVGIAFIIAGLAGLFGLIVAASYIVMHNGQVFQDSFFPVGHTETLLLVTGFILAGIIALLLVLAGLGEVRRKWPIPSWMTGIILGIFFIGLAIGIALAADAAPKVRQRYHAEQHSAKIEIRQPFTEIDIKGNKARYFYDQSDKNEVDINYLGSADISTIKIKVVDQKLTIDTSAFPGQDCSVFCLSPLTVIIHSTGFYPVNLEPGIQVTMP
jgi:phage shock protein PspC (stress-responsive transcriptional regulator)